MKKGWILLVFLAVTLASLAQFDPKKVCRLEDGRLVFTLDKRWTPAQVKEISRMFNLDSALIARAFDLRPMMRDSCYSWKTRRLDANRVELIGEPCKNAEMEASSDRVLLVDDQVIKGNDKPQVDRESVAYGVNKLTRNTIVQLAGNRIRFFLPGQEKARKVYLSGSFNSWSTLATPMEQVDSGWTVTLSLIPGRYTYKYIIDGKWAGDSYNKLREDDTYHGYNNVFFCYNYRFTLAGFPSARTVFVSGSFNNWEPNELRLIRFQGKWVLPLFLREGTHAYKFIVDGNWMTDPANKITRPDGRGNVNSFMSIGDTLYFRLKGFPKAQSVIVSGDFNGWNTEELQMKRTKDGWEIPYVLGRGNYLYKFIVDGRWVIDPANEYRVGKDVTTNSLLVVKPNYWFRLEQHSDAAEVLLSGNFNGWNKSDYRMVENQGTWWFPIYLYPGKYTYKFVVDGKWIMDPGNKLWEENEYGTGNSVLWIEP